jgi:hypothetical protein
MWNSATATAARGRAKADPWGHAVNWPGDIDMGPTSFTSHQRANRKMGAGALCRLDGGARPVAQCGGRCAWAVTSHDRPLSHGLEAHPPCGGARLRGAEHAVEEARGMSTISNPRFAEVNPGYARSTHGYRSLEQCCAAVSIFVAPIALAQSGDAAPRMARKTRHPGYNANGCLLTSAPGAMWEMTYSFAPSLSGNPSKS